MAEKAVQTAKNLIKKAAHDNRDTYLALLEFQNTPLSDKLGSPVQRLMGRRTKTLIPTADSKGTARTYKKQKETKALL